ncbi:MAG: 5'-nucleotidase, lipoprotein e(P4) family [Gemmatimonadota bacterium]
MKIVRRRLLALSLLVAASGCGGGAGPGPSASAAPAPAPLPEATPLPLAVRWVQSSAEHRAVFEEVYLWAGRAVEAEARGRAPGTWAVILDADETVLDNSAYQARRAEAGLGYTPGSWNDWVREAAAPALPGAVAFVGRVRALGGRVAIVTNRDDAVCEPTRRNLAAVGIAADVVLCRAPGEEGKEGRFRAVTEGTAAPGLGPVEVLAFVGDNIHDFPGGTQAWREGLPPGIAGARFFVLPNPMYGSWAR